MGEPDIDTSSGSCQPLSMCCAFLLPFESSSDIMAIIVTPFSSSMQINIFTNTAVSMDLEVPHNSSCIHDFSPTSLFQSFSFHVLHRYCASYSRQYCPYFFWNEHQLAYPYLLPDEQTCHPMLNDAMVQPNHVSGTTTMSPSNGCL
jgi:hypothetical protein